MDFLLFCYVAEVLVEILPQKQKNYVENSAKKVRLKNRHLCIWTTQKITVALKFICKSLAF